MSFVKKAVKKVFKFGKRLVKKTVKFFKRAVKSDWFKVAAIVALSLFTAGIASGGFAAFTSAVGSQGFLSAVGSTIAQGFSSIAGVMTGSQSFTQAFGAASNALGIGAGAAPAVAGAAASPSILAPVANTGTMMAGGSASAASIAGMSTAEMIGAHTLAGGAVAGGGFSGFLGTLGKALGSTGKGLMGDSVGGSMLRMGVITGMQGYFKQKELDKAEGYYRNRTVWGNAAYGGDPQSLALPMPTFPDASQLAAGNTPAQGGGAPQAAPLLPFPQDQGGAAQVAFNEAQAQQGAPQQASPGVPGQQTQPPPANQPQQAPGQPPPGSQLENMGLLA